MPPRSFGAQGDKRLDEACSKIDRVFGKALKQGELDPREGKQLARELERILGERSSWPTAIVRPLYDVVRAGAAGRRRSADHERAWWSLIGYLLRPGFGDPLDAQRIAELEPLYAQGLAFPKESQGFRAWWVAWRRVVGGLREPAQLAIRDTLDPFLAPTLGSLVAVDGRARKKPKNVIAEPFDEVLLLASSLERLPASRRSELGAWILERTWTSSDPLLYAAIGRIGARVPAYASAHHVLSPRIAEGWLSHVLRADWKLVASLPFAATQLARLTGDRACDVSEATRAEVERRLVQCSARAEWIRAVREVVAMDDSQRREMFGEALPIGLRLIGEET